MQPSVRRCVDDLVVVELGRLPRAVVDGLVNVLTKDSTSHLLERAGLQVQLTRYEGAAPRRPAAGKRLTNLLTSLAMLTAALVMLASDMKERKAS